MGKKKKKEDDEKTRRGRREKRDEEEEEEEETLERLKRGRIGGSGCLDALMPWDPGRNTATDAPQNIAVSPPRSNNLHDFHDHHIE